MIPSATHHTPVPKPAVVNPSVSVQKASHPGSPETARTSAGEIAAANIRAESAKAVDAPEQTAVAPRLRDQETSERTDRLSRDTEAPTGPPPAFEETLLQRQARVALDPPDVPDEPVTDEVPEVSDKGDDIALASDPVDPPPTPSERAEASFAETRGIAESRETPKVDVSA